MQSKGNTDALMFPGPDFITKIIWGMAVDCMTEREGKIFFHGESGQAPA